MNGSLVVLCCTALGWGKHFELTSLLVPGATALLRSSVCHNCGYWSVLLCVLGGTDMSAAFCHCCALIGLCVLIDCCQHAITMVTWAWLSVADSSCISFSLCICLLKVHRIRTLQCQVWLVLIATGILGARRASNAHFIYIHNSPNLQRDFCLLLLNGLLKVILLCFFLLLFSCFNTNILILTQVGVKQLHQAT